MIHAPDLLGPLFHHGLSQGDLPVAGNDHLPLVTQSENGGSVEHLFSLRSLVHDLYKFLFIKKNLFFTISNQKSP